MSLRDFTKEYQIHTHNLYVCIGINQKPGYRMESRVNYIINEVIESLKIEIPYYKEINVAYVYETNGLMQVRPFNVLKINERPCYKDLVDNVGSHRMEHVFFMSMEVLKQYENEDCRFYFITDERIPHSNNILYKSQVDIEMNERYQNNKIKVILCKPKSLGSDLLEEYLSVYGNVRKY